MRLDQDKLKALWRWGRGLQQAGGEESAAAGRAILMLVTEIEQLQIDLRLVREQLSRVGPPSSDEAAGTLEEPDPFASTLHERLERAPRAGFGVFFSGTTTAWGRIGIGPGNR